MNPTLPTCDLQPSIELHIEELVLHGFPPGDRYPIQKALQTELERLFGERGLPQSLSQGGEQHHVDGGVFRLSSRARAEAVGRQIANTLYGGFQPRAGDPPLDGRGGSSP